MLGNGSGKRNTFSSAVNKAALNARSGIFKAALGTILGIGNDMYVDKVPGRLWIYL